MFTLETGDYKYIFEYDTPEELEKYINTMTANIEKIEEIKHRHLMAHKAIEKEEKSPKTSSITWSDLEIKFVASKKKAGKVGESTYKAYASTFNKLKEYFNKTKIEEIEIEDYELFREHLADEYEIKNVSINNHMTYVNMFLTYAKRYKLITENNVEGLESLLEEETKKEHFTVIFPTMIGAGKKYIGANTGQLIRVSIAEDDDRIITIKGVP